MNLYLDDRIYHLQAQGGISHLWRKLAPPLQAQLKDVAWGADQPDHFLSTYYASSPDGLASVAMCYDFIAERYPPIGRFHPDAVQKRRAVSEARAVFAISQWVADDVEAVCGKEAVVAYCGTDYRRADPAQVAAFRAKYQLDKSYVLVIGRRHLYKNVQALYQAWQFFPARDDCLVVCIGGESPQQADQHFDRSFPQTWRQLHLDDNEMAAAYTGATMLVYPSLFEGFGLPVLEAMACGCPVVCGQRAGLPEIAQDTAYYADVFRPMALSQAMTEALSPDVERQVKAMSIAKTFTWERMAQQIVQGLKVRLCDNETTG